jgi:hypothetical protein
LSFELPQKCPCHTFAQDLKYFNDPSAIRPYFTDMPSKTAPSQPGHPAGFAAMSAKEAFAWNQLVP